MTDITPLALIPLPLLAFYFIWQRRRQEKQDRQLPVWHEDGIELNVQSSPKLFSNLFILLGIYSVAGILLPEKPDSGMWTRGLILAAAMALFCGGMSYVIRRMPSTYRLVAEGIYVQDCFVKWKDIVRVVTVYHSRGFQKGPLSKIELTTVGDGEEVKRYIIWQVKETSLEDLVPVIERCCIENNNPIKVVHL